MTTDLKIPPDGEYKASAGGYYSTFQWSIYVYKVRFPNGVRGVNIKDTITVKGTNFTSDVLGSGGEVCESDGREDREDFLRRILRLKAYSMRVHCIETRLETLTKVDPAHPEVATLKELISINRLDPQDIAIHRFLVLYHEGKISEIENFLKRK